MKALVPTDTVAPANIGLTSQPASTASFGISSNGCGAINHLIRAFLGIHLLYQKERKSSDCISMFTLMPVELTSIWQCWKGFSQMMLCISIKSPFTGELHPLPKQSHSD